MDLWHLLASASWGPDRRAYCAGCRMADNQLDLVTPPLNRPRSLHMCTCMRLVAIILQSVHYHLHKNSSSPLRVTELKSLDLDAVRRSQILAIYLLLTHLLLSLSIYTGYKRKGTNRLYQIPLGRTFKPHRFHDYHRS